MGVRIVDGATVTVNFDDYFGGEVSVVCKLPTTREYDRFQNDYMKVKGGKIKMDTEAGHKHVVSLIESLEGIDMPSENGSADAWTAITDVGPKEANYLISKHGRLLKSLGDNLFGASVGEVQDDSPLE